MIEAVNSVVANAALVRASAGQADAARSFAANPDRTQEVVQLPQAPFLSLSIGMNLDYDKAVLRLRDSETGDILEQIPSEGRLQAQVQRQQVVIPQQNNGSATAAKQVAEYTNTAQAEPAKPQVDISDVTASSAPVTAPQAAQATVSTGGISVLA